MDLEKNSKKVLWIRDLVNFFSYTRTRRSFDDVKKRG